MQQRYLTITRTAPVKKTVARSRRGCLHVTKTVNFDPDMVAEIEKRARREYVSFSEMVRLLVEWGLEA